MRNLENNFYKTNGYIEEVHKDDNGLDMMIARNRQKQKNVPNGPKLPLQNEREIYVDDLPIYIDQGKSGPKAS